MVLIIVVFSIHSTTINKDVEGINYVINFDYPQNSEDYIHRIGRTGRSEATGTSYALFTKNNGKQARDLIAVLTEANQVREHLRISSIVIIFVVIYKHPLHLGGCTFNQIAAYQCYGGRVMALGSNAFG